MVAQKTIRYIESMPAVPSPYCMKNWGEHARAYDRYVFNADLTGDYLPLVWEDAEGRNTGRTGFGLYSYVGSRSQGSGGEHEAINCAGTVLGSTLAGMDKSDRSERNRVLMCENYFNRDNGMNLFLNRTDMLAGGSFWYDIYPHLLLHGLAWYYPDTGALGDIVRITAERWREACIGMLPDRVGLGAVPDFNWTGFDFAAMRPVFNGEHREPDAAAGIGYLQYMTYAREGNPRFLEAAEWCLEFLSRFPGNPFYEVLMPFGAAVAARMNAEMGKHYPVQTFLEWCFAGDSTVRPGWGVIRDRWGSCDCHGLCGSLIDWGQYCLPVDTGNMEERIARHGGYAFTMNTFAMAAALVPLVRYAPQYAAAIGKWLLHVANNARLFYPDAHDRLHQSCSFWQGDPDNLIAYEGLRRYWDGREPYAAGDPIRFSWGSLDLGIYGSSHVGFLGGMVKETDCSGILAVDCLKTDYNHQPAYPTTLYYNPWPDDRTVSLDPPEAGPVACYDVITGKIIIRERSAAAAMTVPGGKAVLAVEYPAQLVPEQRNGHLYAGNVLIDFFGGTG